MDALITLLRWSSASKLLRFNSFIGLISWRNAVIISIVFITSKRYGSDIAAANLISYRLLGHRAFIRTAFSFTKVYIFQNCWTNTCSILLPPPT